RAVGISSLITYPLCVLVLAAGVLTLCQRFPSALPAAAWEPTFLCIAFLLLVDVGWMFGQREHLTALLILPYSFAAAGFASGGLSSSLSSRLAAGVLAGIGFGLKPYFLLALVVVEAYLLFRRGPWSLLRSEALGIGVVLVLYAVAVATLTPQYLP